MLLQSAKPIIDTEIRLFLNSLTLTDIMHEEIHYGTGYNYHRFKSTYHKWITNISSNFNIYNIDTWNQYVVDGISDAFDQFSIEYSDKRTIYAKGEYAHHKLTGATELSLAPMPGDKLVISYPFSATGGIHQGFHSLMELCYANDVPVFIDAAFHGICKVDSLDVKEYPAIKWIAFSPSKTFGTGSITRIGMVYTKDPVLKCSMGVTNEHIYLNHLAMNLHYHMLNTYDSNYLWNKYRSKQVELCQRLELEPSQTLIFGTSDDEAWDKFRKGDMINRICLSNEIEI